MFEGPRLKIKRANQHIADLQNAIDVFVKTDFCSFGIEFDANTGDHVVRFKMTKAAPCDLPLIIGDAIHNLRSALDLAYCEILAAIGQQPTDYSRFIFEEDREKLVTKLNSGPMKAAPDIIDVIADVIKPYKTAHNPLFILHNLDVSDKHFLLIPTFGVAELRNLDAQIVIGTSTNIVMKECALAVGEGGVINFMGLGGGVSPDKVKLKGTGNPFFSVCFRKGQVLEGQPVVPTLHQLSQVVGGILEILEKAVRSRQTASG
jgi:hypothetical protein